MAKLNELNGKEWVQHTKSWFVLNGKTRDKEVLNHPAKYPEELAKRFIEFFTSEDETVFDPFIGVGSTGVAANELHRNCKGIEINREFAEVAQNRAQYEEIITGDSRQKRNFPNEKVDFILTSPPYWDILKKKRGHSDSQHNEREKKTSLVL